MASGSLPPEIKEGDIIPASIYTADIQPARQSPVVSALLAYSRAKETGECGDNIRICLEALKDDPQNPTIYLTLGRIYLLSGQKRSAHRSFQLGMRYGRNHELVKELARLGIRKKPTLGFLPREHSLNVFLGRTFKKLGLR